MPLKILLINPGQLTNVGEDQFAGRFDAACFRVKPFSETYFGLPLAIPTLAGLTPAKHHVKIVDEMVEPINFDERCDIVGLSAMTCKATRAYEIATEFRRRGIPVIMGGIHATVCPEEVAKHVDCVVVGEADEIWRSILEDFENGLMKSRYISSKLPNLANVPPPRHDLTAYTKYAAYFLQTTRGCPRSCKFCTVTEVNGKTLRKKTPEQVVAEVKSAISLPNPICPTIVDRANSDRKRKIASATIFFVDDNFAFDRNHALAVCRALKAFEDDNNVHINWFTQSDVKTGFDDELLAAMKDAGCMNIFIGFESLNEATLKAMKKNVNSPERYRECIESIERHGIEVTASVIVGTDHETLETQEEMIRFARENRIFYFFPNVMTPYPGTHLMQEMESDGRILRREPELYNIRNVIFSPKQMSPFELQSIYKELCKSVLDVSRLLQCATEKLKKPKRYYLTVPWRFVVWLAFMFLFTIFMMRKKITLSDYIRLIYYVPKFVLFNGSLAALGFLSNSVGFGAFARGEAVRFPYSAGATWRNS
jgi:radical SAM superfamily enzyme YgiQ (UPF0313 family)